MGFEILHFRGSDSILTNLNMLEEVQATMEYIDITLTNTLFKRELFKQALEDMDWLHGNGDMTFIEGRRYKYKGVRKEIAIEGNFAAYEYILEGLFRLQIGFDRGIIQTGILILNGKRGKNSPYGSTAKMVSEDVALLYPTISMPVSITLFDLGEPTLPE